jgi:hypothetical protein
VSIAGEKGWLDALVRWSKGPEGPPDYSEWKKRAYASREKAALPEEWAVVEVTLDGSGVRQQIVETGFADEAAAAQWIALRKLAKVVLTDFYAALNDAALAKRLAAAPVIGRK